MLSTSYPHQTPSILDKIRVKAVARKAIRNGQNFQQIQNKLLQDNYFEVKKSRLDEDRIEQLTKDTLIEALNIENRTAERNMNDIFGKLF